MKEALRLAETVAPHETTVVILGETGTGKGLLARHIHECSPRWTKPFVELNCAGLQKELAESELFGHEKGAFTGAAERKLGLFEAAAGGTLFLDEVGELDLGVQAKLLRAIEDKRLRRVGGLQEIAIDVRLLAATHKSLEREVAAARFRRDLFYRLSVFAVRLPALRERPEDILPLARHFLDRYCPGLALSPAARESLESYPWPGNVRELRNVIERAGILARGERELWPSHLPLPAAWDTLRDLGEDPAQRPRPLTIRETERESIEEALCAHRGNVAAAAAQLGVSRGTVYRKARKYNIAL
jgi:transcriptional regulator with PAS, ATPase and Fis domain